MVFHKTFTCWLRESERGTETVLLRLQARQRTRQKRFRHAIEHDTTTPIRIRQINPSSLSVHLERTRTRRGRTTYEIRAMGIEVNKKEVMISSSELGRKTS